MNWKHSLYEIYAITFGQSFTIDEAYRLLTELREDRLFAIASSFAESKRAQAKVLDAELTKKEYETKSASVSKANLRRAEAFILETDARFIIAQPCLDMSRVELGFIEHLITYIDDKGLRLHSDFALGSQLVQPAELAYEYIWAGAFDGLHSDLARNIYAHPDAEVILKIMRDAEFIQDPSRLNLVTRLAEHYQIPMTHTAVSVNVVDMIPTAVPTQLATYGTSNTTSLRKLQEKALANPPGNSVPSPRVEGGR